MAARYARRQVLTLMRTRGILLNAGGGTFDVTASEDGPNVLTYGGVITGARESDEDWPGNVGALG